MDSDSAEIGIILIVPVAMLCTCAYLHFRVYREESWMQKIAFIYPYGLPVAYRYDSIN